MAFSLKNALTNVGHYVNGLFSSVPYFLGYLGRLISCLFVFLKKGKAVRRILIMQLLFTFIEALPVVCVLSAAIGGAIYLIGYSFLSSIGYSSLIYKLLVTIVIQELGPILVAFIVTARSATAIATELGTMVVTHQIEAYVATGIDPVAHLVAPRFVGVSLSTFFLNLYFAFCGILGPVLLSYFVSNVTTYGYFQGIFSALTISAILTSLIKSLLFGVIISISATYCGFAVERASTEVPVAGINAVGKSILGVILFDVFIIAVPYLVG